MLLPIVLPINPISFTPNNSILVVKGWMNLTARIKETRKKPPIVDDNPKYVLNLSIDIPLNSKYAITNRQESSDYSPSPNKLKRKFELSITPMKSKTRSEAFQPHSSRPSNGQKKLSTISYQPKNNKIQKYKSIELAYKRKRKHSSKPSQMVRNISILECLQKDDPDNVIKYTNKTLEQSNDRQETKAKLLSSSSYLDLLNVNEIREYEGMATDRRERLNYQYLKNVQMEASAKKIQRAWRNYRTKKLLRSYSENIVKCKPELQGGLSLSSSQNNKDLFWKKKKMVFRTLNRSNEKDSIKNENSEEHSLPDNCLFRFGLIDTDIKLDDDFKEKTRDITTKLHQFQNDPNDRFEKYIGKLQRNRNNQKSQDANKEFIGQHIQPEEVFYRRSPQPFTINRADQVQSESQQSSDSYFSQSRTAEKRMEKIEFFENQIKNIDNEISEISCSSISLSPEQNKLIQTLENQKLRKKLTLFDQIELFKLQNDSYLYENGRLYQDSSIANPYGQEFSPISGKDMSKDMDEIIRLKQKKMEQDRGINAQGKRQSVKPKSYNNQVKTEKESSSHLKNEDLLKFYSKTMIAERPTQEQGKSASIIKVKEFSQNHNKSAEFPQINPFEPTSSEKQTELGKRLDKLAVMQQLDLCSLLVEELILESLLDFSDSDAIVSRMNYLLALISIQNSQEHESVIEKPEGICTNLQSIKEYLENLVSFVLDSHKALVIKGINTNAGPTATVLFQYLRKIQVDDYEGNSTVIPLAIFEEHWNLASAQIYFDKKFDDPNLESERVRYLKGLTKIYFRAIFDAFNESLDFERTFGILGKPYPWKNQPKFTHKTGQIKNAMRKSYKRLSIVSTVYCGLHFDDKKHPIPEEVIKDVKEQRMNNLLQLELAEQQTKWNFFNDEEAEGLYIVSLQIEEDLIREALAAISSLQQS